ncbi:MAG: exosortase A [Terriglobales bacterium]
MGTTDAVRPMPQSRTELRGLVWQGIALLPLIAWLYAGVIPHLVSDWWNNPDFSHGFLVPLFSLFLVWQDRKRLSELPLRPSWWGLAVMAGAMMQLIVGTLGAEFFLSRSSLILLVAGMVIFFLGWGYFRALLFPLGFLFLMIPIPAILFNQITIPLQFLASTMASSLVAEVGVPVLRQGNIIQLPGMTLEVAEACSGIRSLMSLTTVAVIYAYFLETKLLPRVLLSVSAVPIAVIANGLRVTGTALLAFYWDKEAAEGFFHNFSGWLIFVLSLLMLFGLQGLMSWVRKRRKPKEATS